VKGFVALAFILFLGAVVGYWWRGRRSA